MGEHLQDHPLATATYAVNEPVTLFDATHPKYLVEYLVGQGRGKLSSNVAEAGAFFRTRSELRSPDMEFLMGAAYYSDNGFRTYPGTRSRSGHRSSGRRPRARCGCARRTRTTSR